MLSVRSPGPLVRRGLSRGGSAPASSVLSCRYDDMPRLKRSCSAEKECSMQIYVGNLAFTATVDEVRQLFEPYGDVARVNLPEDRETGRPRGFGFVEMPNDTEARAAIAGLNGKDLGGRSLMVNEARPGKNAGGHVVVLGGKRYACTSASPWRFRPASAQTTCPAAWLSL